MEWQIVTGFFEWLNSDRLADKLFPNPDPHKIKNEDKVGFCEYFESTWVLDAGLDNMKTKENNKLQAFTLIGSKDGKNDKRTPRQHLAAAFPSTHKWHEEFVYLEHYINTPTKANVGFSTPTCCHISSLTVAFADEYLHHRCLVQSRKIWCLPQIQKGKIFRQRSLPRQNW